MATRVLIVDDELHVTVALRVKFAKAGYDVTTAMDGQEAWEEIQRQPPELMIADVVMPNVDGFELVKRVREHPPIADLPVILLTATAVEQKTRDLAKELNIAEVVAKPFSIKNVLRSAERLVGQKSSSVGV
jgi:two-component system alkaline phosphatase synthesis response regulator PhoP